MNVVCERARMPNTKGRRGILTTTSQRASDSVRSCQRKNQNMDRLSPMDLSELAEEVTNWHCRVRETVHENSLKLPLEEMQHYKCICNTAMA